MSMFGYVKRFNKRVLNLFDKMRHISKIDDDELKYAIYYYTKKHPVTGEDNDLISFITWYSKVENFDLVHFNFILDGGKFNNGKN